jgi:ABC-type transport system involved in multi-copper enzyme maturation permease subunit
MGIAMSTGLLQLGVLTLVLFVVQGLAALPWLYAISRRPLREHLPVLGGVILVGFIAFTGILDYYSDPVVLVRAGRTYMSILQLQLTLDLFVAVFMVTLAVWPKGGAVALAAFQEGVRQPMFWMLTIVGSGVMVISVFIPYFTFGEDLKMVKELCYAFTMLGPAIFGVAAACTSVTEEIEGRTAVTLMSKPISRRQFLLGKFTGITLAGLLMTALMGWVLVWVVVYKNWYDSFSPVNQVDTTDPAWVLSLVESTLPDTTAGELIRGLGVWTHDAITALPGLIIGFCQVAVLTAVAVALATRIPMVVNLTMCLLVYLLGHLTPIMTEVTRVEYKLVYFVAQLFETLLPGLDLFDVGSSIIRDQPLDPVSYGVYTFHVAVYALMYTTIALLVGLILFEDRDLA